MSNTVRRFELLKDLPTVKIWEHFVWNEFSAMYVGINRWGGNEMFTKSFVERGCPEWFREIKEQPKKIPVSESEYRGMIYQRNIQNPYPSESQSHTAYDKGFEESWCHFFKPEEPKEEFKWKYWFQTTRQIHPDKFDSIKQAIENILNSKP